LFWLKHAIGYALFNTPGNASCDVCFNVRCNARSDIRSNASRAFNPVTTPSAPEVLNTPAPRVVLVDGSSGYRHLISSYLITNWPDAVIEAIDPFSQTMRGPGMAFGATGDVIIIGGIGTGSEAISVLERLRKRSACPPVILLVAQALMAESAALIAAGATGIKTPYQKIACASSSMPV